ncbi:ankyrin repeat domain-containing protein [Serratia marcescens]|nr:MULTISPECIES: ankyrin repeat domain-containing protein [Serratia]MBM1298547.1 ankyrin repeat domain-containing protein [Serratia nematodiphila]MBH2575376.1 ankyrin repeat domain-containing protein [Serratia marcescens]MBH2613336.1 ankyrin repeat domain-containing protein [Serratia marcescens]MBH2932701.1 ankyrin repeat domain-containing protein [Serratia marcescens]MBN5332099.1 ankyrin repeat domain-containing protein [Serratia marcescens]
MPEGRRLRRALAIALLALVAVTGLLMMAKEQQMGQEISPFDGRGNLALAQAVARGDAQSIHAQATQDRLRERGDRQVTLLQWAVLSQQPASVQALLDLGADPSVAGLDGNSALHTAAILQDVQYLRLLLAEGAQVNVRNAVTGATPLAAAVLAGREEQLRLLLAAGADTTLSDRLGDTPLHLAAKINAPHLALLLLQAGADAQARNQQGYAFQFYFSQTPAHLQNDELKAQFRELDKWLQGRRLATHYAQQ